MTPVQLIEEVKTALTDELKEYRYRNGLDEIQGITVNFELNDEEFADEKHYPLILVNLVSIEDRITESIAEIEMTVGTYGEDDTCYIELLNIVERVRMCLIVNDPINRKFKRIDGIQTKFPANNPFPYRFAYISAKYYVNRR